MLKIWGRKNSSNVQKVMWAVGETAVAHAHTEVGGAFGGNREPAFLALNPNGLVPVIQDGAVVMWESNAIVRYIAVKYGAGRLAPADPLMRARADQWMDWQQTSVNAPMAFNIWIPAVIHGPSQPMFTGWLKSVMAQATGTSSSPPIIM